MNVSKKFLALIMAMLMAFSCMAVSASAEGEGVPNLEPAPDATDPVTVVDLSTKLAKPVLVLDAEKKTITVTNYTKKPIYEAEDGTKYDLKVTISPEEDVIIAYDEDDHFFFNQLAYGTTYTVTVTAVDPDAEDNVEVKGSVTNTAKLLEKQDAPAAPVPFEITSKSIKITTVKNYLYTITDIDGANIGYDWVKATSTAMEFDVPNPGEKYIISVKIPANTTHYESDATSITVTAKKANDKGVPEFGLVDKTDSSITVTEDKTVEYSLDGKKWQKSNVFTGLTSNTQYTIYARYITEADTDPSTVSEALVVKTNAKANYEAKEKNIVFTAEDGQYANSEIKFTVKGDGPANMSEAIYGDTRIVPVSYEVVFGNDSIKDTIKFEGKKVSQNGSFTAPGYEEKVVSVKVTFILEEYKGEDWKPVEEFTKSYDVKIGRTGDTGTKVLEGFEVVFNFLFNTIPAFFAEALKSDVWARLFEVLGNIGKTTG